MDFLKKNFEKVILIAVLVGLASASAYLVFNVGQVQEFLRETETKVLDSAGEKLKPVNLTTNEAALNRVVEGLDFKPTKDHNIFNPVTWQQRPDGSRIKLLEAGQGVNALKVTAITNLYLIIAYEGTNGSGDSLRYQFAFTRQEEKLARLRYRVPYFASPSGGQAGLDKNKFILREVRGPKEDPESFVLELIDGNRIIHVKKGQPFTEVSGYMADLLYVPENRPFLQKRTGETIPFAGDTFTLVIREKDVILQSTRTQKKTTRPGPGA